MHCMAIGNPTPYNCDDEARTELLAFLVIEQLIARTITGTWLSSLHVTESVQLWLDCNGANCCAQERTILSAFSVEVASQMLNLPNHRDEQWLAGLLARSWRLDYRQAAVGALHDVCADYLVRHNKPAGL
jgi:hypothetical protein